MSRSFGHSSHRQNSSDDGHFEYEHLYLQRYIYISTYLHVCRYEHSRSSSLGDINWGYGGQAVDTARMAGVATPDGFKSLPYDHMTSVKLAINGVKKQRAMAPRSGAVKIDLTCADKSIRRPGSAPDLAGGEEGAGPQCHASPGANSLRSAKH